MTAATQALDAPVILARPDVTVWRVELDLDGAIAGGLESSLTPDERARAGRYRGERDRRRFVVARAHLRAILAGVLDVRPGDVVLAVDALGKPRLAGAAAPGLDFSVSHSGGRALVAVARHRRVGVDLERIEEAADWEPIAARFFSAREVAALRALGEAERRGEFYRLWTRKEAWLKARGDGLGAGEALLRAEPGADGGSWSILTLDAGPGYAAALAVTAERAGSCGRTPEA